MENLAVKEEMVYSIIRDTSKYEIRQYADGSFKKIMKYRKIWTYEPKTENEKIDLYNVLNSQDVPTPLKKMIDETITIAHVFTNPYEKFDEETGDESHGVTTTFMDTDGKYYVTSSKMVYYRILDIIEQFENPALDDYHPIIVRVRSQKREKGDQILIELVGFEK